MIPPISELGLDPRIPEQYQAYRELLNNQNDHLPGVRKFYQLTHTNK